MSEPKAIVGTDVADAEVELSAADLLELSAPCVDNKPTQQPLPKTTSTVVRAAPAAVRRRMSLPRASVSVTFAFGAIGALYFLMTPSDDASQPTTQARVTQSQSPALAPTAEGKPVLFANPFDANEVFEFPAGTSEAEARDAVAEVLMDRAMKRQRQFDARVSSNR